MRLQDCRTTFLCPQALLAFVVGLAACGQERPTEPLAAFAHEAGDTVGVLRAVASAIAEMNARAQTARSAPDYPANCRWPGLICWKIETSGWYVMTGDRGAMMLADLLGVRAGTLSPGAAPPPCPWPPGAPGSGYRAAIRVRFAGPDLAEVTLDRKCDNPPASLHDIFSVGETFEVRRGRGAWQAKIIGARIT